jgi:hypothetical protein
VSLTRAFPDAELVRIKDLGEKGLIEMTKQYYVQRERAHDYTVRVTNGLSSEIIDSFTSKSAAQARANELNYPDWAPRSKNITTIIAAAAVLITVAVSATAQENRVWSEIIDSRARQEERWRAEEQRNQQEWRYWEQQQKQQDLDDRLRALELEKMTRRR